MGKKCLLPFAQILSLGIFATTAHAETTFTTDSFSQPQLNADQSFNLGLSTGDNGKNFVDSYVQFTVPDHEDFSFIRGNYSENQTANFNSVAPNFCDARSDDRCIGLDANSITDTVDGQLYCYPESGSEQRVGEQDWVKCSGTIVGFPIVRKPVTMVPKSCDARSDSRCIGLAANSTTETVDGKLFCYPESGTEQTVGDQDFVKCSGTIVGFPSDRKPVAALPRFCDARSDDQCIGLDASSITETSDGQLYCYAELGSEQTVGEQAWVRCSVTIVGLPSTPRPAQ